MKCAQTQLRSEFPNGLFGDPALGIWVKNGNDGVLMDCGDLSRFSTQQLLKVRAIFLSHCHMDHFFGFDAFLRVHIGVEKTVTLFGPPDTSARLLGKLQGYTWNLVEGDNTQFIAVDLDLAARKKTTTHFHSADRFHPSGVFSENWDPTQPIYSTEDYFVKTTLLDHRTPSLAYAIEEQLTYALNIKRTLELGIQTGPWIHELKKNFFRETIELPLIDGTLKIFNTTALRSEIFSQKPQQKIAYVTDGAAHTNNHQALKSLILNADLLFAETCFLPEDQKLADKTKHFTTEFIAQLAQEAGVKKLVPFHFSKRYKSRPEDLLNSISHSFKGEVLTFQPAVTT
jgi:ribonuclease Z